MEWLLLTVPVGRLQPYHSFRKGQSLQGVLKSSPWMMSVSSGSDPRDPFPARRCVGPRDCRY